MTEDTTKNVTPAPTGAAPAAPAAGRGPRDERGDARTFRIRRGGDRGGRGGGRFGGRGPRRDRGGENVEQSDYEEKTLEINRVTRVTKGGKRMRFRALGVVGNRKGRVGFGIAKGLDVAAANAKAFTKARKSLITVPIVNETIPHEVRTKYCSAEIIIKPAPKGTGVKAGGSVRHVLEIAGIPNVVSKILGSSNKLNNVKATIKALRMLRTPSLPPKKETADEAVKAQA